jgi:hypothetical protein
MAAVLSAEAISVLIDTYFSKEIHNDFCYPYVPNIDFLRANHVFEDREKAMKFLQYLVELDEVRDDETEFKDKSSKICNYSDHLVEEFYKEQRYDFEHGKLSGDDKVGYHKECAEEAESKANRIAVFAAEATVEAAKCLRFAEQKIAEGKAKQVEAEQAEADDATNKATLAAASKIADDEAQDANEKLDDANMFVVNALREIDTCKWEIEYHNKKAAKAAADIEEKCHKKAKTAADE